VVMTPEEVTTLPTFGVEEIRGDWGSKKRRTYSTIQQDRHGHSCDEVHDGSRDPALVETNQEVKESSS
jgi:hypothetical protein